VADGVGGKEKLMEDRWCSLPMKVDDWKCKSNLHGGWKNNWWMNDVEVMSKMRRFHWWWGKNNCWWVMKEK
jgi:hypothetical protein